MKNLWLSSFIVLIFAGCKLGHYRKMQPAQGSVTALTPIFANNFNSFLFKTNIKAYGKDFSGLLVTKQMQPKDYRVIFTTELGMKIFDFEFRDSMFTVHYSIPQFNRPSLLKIIQEDIETLLMNQLEGKRVMHYEDKESECEVHRIQSGNYYNYYFIEKSSRQLKKIERSKKERIKTIFTLNNYNDNFPTNIVIKHYDVRLKIELSLLKK